MKKLLLIAILALGFSKASNSQNNLTVHVHQGVCINEITINFDDGTRDLLAIGCKGKYDFDLGTRIIKNYTIDGVTVEPGETTEILLKSGESVKAKPAKVLKIDQQKLDSILQLIR